MSDRESSSDDDGAQYSAPIGCGKFADPEEHALDSKTPNSDSAEGAAGGDSLDSAGDSDSITSFTRCETDARTSGSPQVNSKETPASQPSRSSASYVLARAVAHVKSGVSQCQTAKIFGVSQSTLLRYIHKPGTTIRKQRRPCRLNEKEEAVIAEVAKELAFSGIPLPYSQIAELAKTNIEELPRSRQRSLPFHDNKPGKNGCEVSARDRNSTRTAVNPSNGKSGGHASSSLSRALYSSQNYLRTL